MIPNVLPTDDFVSRIRVALPDVAPFDVAAKVRMQTTGFNPADISTWVASRSPVYTAKSGASGWALVYDAASAQWYLQSPDPEDGWLFTSSGAGDPVIGFSVTNDEDDPIGANSFTTPVPVTASGQTITLPYVNLPLASLFAGSVSPVDA